MKKGWPQPKNPAFCRSHRRHHFSEYGFPMRRVDHCVRCGAKKVAVLAAQRERQRRKGQEGRS